MFSCTYQYFSDILHSQGYQNKQENKEYLRKPGNELHYEKRTEFKAAGHG